MQDNRFAAGTADRNNHKQLCSMQRTFSPVSVRVTKLFLEADGFNTSEKLTLQIDDYEDYSEQLKAYRKRNKIKQTELAELLCVNQYTLRSWEQKQAKPPYHVWRLFKEYARGNDIID